MNAIILKDQNTLVGLLAWRDANKDLVRQGDIPVIEGIKVSSGSIMFQDAVELAFHRHDENRVTLRYYEGVRNLGAKFTFNFQTYEVYDVEYNSKVAYPQQDAIQDMLTIYASTMAFMAHNQSAVDVDATTFTINA